MFRRLYNILLWILFLILSLLAAPISLFTYILFNVEFDTLQDYISDFVDSLEFNGESTLMIDTRYILMLYVIVMVAFLTAYALDASLLIRIISTILALSMSIWLFILGWIGIKEEFSEDVDNR